MMSWLHELHARDPWAPMALAFLVASAVVALGAVLNAIAESARR